MQKKTKLTPKEHVMKELNAKKPNKARIQAYMTRYFKLQREEEIKTVKKIFK